MAYDRAYDPNVSTMERTAILSDRQNQKKDLPANIRPERASMTSTLGADNQLSDAYKLKGEKIQGVDSNIGALQGKLDNIQLNKQGLEAVRSKALSQGPSTWAQMAEGKQRQEELQQRGQTATQAGSNQAQARSNLAMRGGLSGGARERLASSGAKDLMNAQQGIGAQGQQARANIGLQDEQQKQSMLMQLPGMEVQALQPELQKTSAWQQMAQGEQGLEANRRSQEANFSQQANLQNMQNTMGAINAKNQDAMNQYNEGMKSWAAENQARATERSGQK